MKVLLFPSGGAPLAGLTLREGRLAYIFGTGSNDIIQSGEVRILDVATGSLLGVKSITQAFRVVDMSADRVAYQNGNDLMVSSLDFAITGKITTMGETQYPRVVLRGQYAWWISQRTRRYDLENPLHPVLVDDLNLDGGTGSNTYAYGESWVARFANGSGTVYFYDLSENASNHLPLALVTGGTARERDGHVTATITLDKASSVDTSVRFTTGDASARAGQDYIAVDHRVTIPAGQLSATVDVPLIEDSMVEGNESLFVRLSEPQGLRIGQGSSTTVILGSGVACWERSLVGSPAPADRAQVGTTFGTVLATTDTRVIARVASDSPNAGMLALYDMESLRLLKILDVSTNYLLSVTVEGNKVRIVNAPWSYADCTQIDAETGIVDSSGYVEVPVGFYDYKRYFWQDSRHIVVIPERSSTWMVYDITQSSSPITITLPGSVTGTSAFTVDDRYIAASVVTQTSPFFDDMHLSIRVYDRATLTPLASYPFPADPRPTSGNGTISSSICLIPGAVVSFSGGRVDACDLLTGASRWTATGISTSGGIYGSATPFSSGNMILLPQSEASYRVMDGASGAILDSYETHRASSYFDGYYRLDRSVSGFCGTDRQKAFRVFFVPNEPVFDADPVTGPENADMIATLRPRERFINARPLFFQELTPFFGGMEFTKMPGSVTATPGLVDSTTILTPANDRTIRTDDRSATITFAATAHPWEVVCRLTAKVTEDDEELPSVPPFATNPATNPGLALRLAVSDPWMVTDNGNTISVYSTSGTFLRSFPVPFQDPYATLLIRGGRLFYATPGLDLVKLGKTYFDIGAISVYDLSTGKLVATLANNITTERFGSTMAASDRYLAVGATLSTANNGSAGGSISVFDLTTLKRVLRKTSSAVNYGQSIAVWQDRLYYGITDTVLKTPTGEQYRNTGSVTALSLPRGTVLSTLTAPMPPAGIYYDGLYFGAALTVSRDKLIVYESDRGYTNYGRGAVHAYNLPDHSRAWTLRRPDLGDNGLTNGLDIDPRMFAGGNTLALVTPTTFIDLPTGRIAGSRLTPASPYLFYPGAIDSGYYYWADTDIHRMPVPALPVPPEPPQPPDPEPVSDPQSFTQWANLNVGSAGPTSSRELDADPDGDGLSNWQEFVLGSHPLRSGAKSPVITQYPGWMAMTYRRANPSIGRPVHPEFSTDLVHWTRQLPDWCRAWSQGTTDGVETIELDIETTGAPKGWVRYSFLD
ncbi:MAG: Calx-beta domain-containing protein [Luteolibacter sp.]